MEWYQPDDRWEIWGINSKETFVEKFVVPGKFHDKVPKDVVDAFKTVTYLMAHAYFYYPIYDEAMSKALLIMEMAVKLKAKDLGISLKKPANKKGVVYDKKLFKIIEEVCEHPHLVFLKPEFDRAKKIRNRKMHPKSHSVYGALGFTNGNTMLFINIINKLFLEKNRLLHILNRQEELKKEIQRFRDGRYILTFNELKILVWKIYDIKYFKYQDKEFFYIYVGVVSQNIEQDIVQNRINPLVISLRELTISETGFKGLDVDGCPVKLTKNIDLRNILSYQKYHTAKLQLPFDNLRFYLEQNERLVLWHYEELMYEHCW
ncbi:hypothetical protein [Flavobacterium sp. ASW18X]|uniref:hypothetical protein n=1 Tax=Flavobacterium sp. ASW18X TaxID=2572595 RepID=UPI0010AE7AAE|nr:hypothetical protein [Flavobacterium sp. ASW18X]TKD66536.1 hypothetical protein FBT53_01380 [Flavobacterium sp. ASW18X]